MRRGDLAQHPVGQVLLQAAAEELSGGIDFHTDAPGCVHLVDGQVYLAVAADRPVTVDLDEEIDDRSLAVEERRVRDHSIEVLSALLPATEGWYFFHPLNHHPARGWWQWDTEALLADARLQPDVVDAAQGSWASPDHVRLHPTPPSHPLSPATWDVIVALSRPEAPQTLARRLGWTEEHLGGVLAGMAAVGLIQAEGRPALAAPASPTTERVRSDDTPAPDETPIPAPAPAPSPDAASVGSQRSALRRLIDSLRPAS